MKELSIKQKAKAYDKVLINARMFYKDDHVSDDVNNLLEVLFPELKESEDERIREKLIDTFNFYDPAMNSPFLLGIDKKDIIAWLEKQESVGEIVERYKNSWYNEGKIAGMTEGLTDDEKYQQGWHDALEKQGEQKPIINVPSREVILAIWDLGNEWKELTNGSISTEYGTQLNYIQKHWHESEYYLKVKQGENHADKVESKFHEGDWVVIKANGNEHVKQIVRIEYFTSGHPQYILSDGLWFGNGTEARLWTIEDVKPGDVLYSPCCKLLWIYKDDNSCYVGHNLNYSENCVVVNSPICIPSDVCPATKEQRDTLERAITDAGYTFDFDKKEPKKIEQKPTDKVETKFHKGQWIVWQDECYKVNYNGCGYELVDKNGLSILLDYGTIDENAHLWDVTKDAKPGDVLSSEDKDKVFLYNGKLDLRGRVCAYCGIYKTYDGLRFTKCAIGNHFTYKEPYPATKEQRDLLFQKMKEEGYEWDAEKKELKEIKNDYEPDAFIEESYQQQADDLIDMVTEKSTWSEEDWNYIADLISYFNGSSLQHDTLDVISWLKSLKPQTTWKPSDEQVAALSGINVTGCISYAGQGQELINLYNDLKKLMEE